MWMMKEISHRLRGKEEPLRQRIHVIYRSLKEFEMKSLYSTALKFIEPFATT